MDSKVKIRYMISKTSDDRWPVVFRPDCEKTFCNGYGNSDTLIKLIELSEKSNYELHDELPEKYRK